MPVLEYTSDELIERLLAISENEPVSLMDSCGSGKAGEGILVAGIGAAEVMRVEAGEEALNDLQSMIDRSAACFFTLSYELGMALQGIDRRDKEFETSEEPGIYAVSCDALVCHDYATGRTVVEGGPAAADKIVSSLKAAGAMSGSGASTSSFAVTSDIPKAAYIQKISEIQELIRSGETYQTNLTQKISGSLPKELSAQEIFRRLRKQHPAEFASFFSRGSDCIVSISPERFFRVHDFCPGADGPAARIKASPIKGTRPRSGDTETDFRMKLELAESGKDRAENTMIVDLLRNDLGRVCDYGSVVVSSLCEIEDLPSLFHLVSTIEGDLSAGCLFSDIIRALFPCGSITGCPKIRTMQIIDSLEPSERGLSMGAIGYTFRTDEFPSLSHAFGSSRRSAAENRCIDLSVAIRTMLIRDGRVEFNVGGGIVIDSDPESEYAESLDKARALLTALGAKLADPANN